MFTLVYGNDLFDFPRLANEMFTDRRVQFKEDLGWDLDIDPEGREIDQYDLMNPLYVILKNDAGRHLASGRLLPTTGPTMIADHFSDLTDDVAIESSLIWEVTRVFVAERGKDSVRNAARLMWGGAQIGLRSGVEFYVSVTPKYMTRVFAACGWPAEIIGEKVTEKDGHLCACLWEINEKNCDALARKARIDTSAMDLRVHRKPIRAPQTKALNPAFLPPVGSAAPATRIC
ncbi:MAG: acyl-homoserine-lactone synthase [Paracoccaceae bacterium]